MINSRKLLVSTCIYLFSLFTFFICAMQLSNCLGDYYLGPYGDEGQFIGSIVKVSYGIDLWHELSKLEMDYRHIFTKLIWAGNYLFANGTNLFSSIVVLLFLSLYMFTLIRLLAKEPISGNFKLIITCAFFLANLGGFGLHSITMPVFATWPIVLTGIFVGIFFLVRAVEASQAATKNRRDIIFNLTMAHIFGAIALCTFGHGFLYFLFFAMILWCYQQKPLKIFIYCLPGIFLTYLYTRGNHAAGNALVRLESHDGFIYKFFYYYCRTLADAVFPLTKNFNVTFLIGGIGFIFLLDILWGALLRNKTNFRSTNPLYACLVGTFVFSLIGTMLAVFARFPEVLVGYPQIPERFSVLTDTLWAATASIAVLDLFYLPKQYTNYSISKIKYKIIILFALSLLACRQYKFDMHNIGLFFNNSLYVEQALNLHNGYLARQGDPAQWIWFDENDMAMRTRGMSGYAIKERFLVGLKIGRDLTIVNANKCQVSSTVMPNSIKTYDHLTNPGFYLDGVLKETGKRHVKFSSVILITGRDNKVVGFGYRGRMQHTWWGKALHQTNFFAVSPWQNDQKYSLYLLTKNRQNVCLLTDNLIIPKRDPSFLKNSIAALQYKGRDNQYLLFPDYRMQMHPHFVALFFPDKGQSIKPYKAENIPFDARLSSNELTLASENNDGIKFMLPDFVTKQLRGHKVKIKLLVKQAPDAPSTTAGFFYGYPGNNKYIIFTPQKAWHTVERVIAIPPYARNNSFFSVMADKSGRNKGIILRAIMLEKMD